MPLEISRYPYIVARPADPLLCPTPPPHPTGVLYTVLVPSLAMRC
jgi:hypothetical protein